MSTLLEVGYDNVKSQKTDEPTTSTKSPWHNNGRQATASGPVRLSVSSQPTRSGMRNGATRTAGYSGVAYSDTSAKTFSRGDNDEWTFGAQMEIWW
jgi:maltoporin